MKLLSASIVAVVGTLMVTTSIYSYSIPKIEGSTQQLSAYQGKKIMIMTLPIQQSAAADSMLYSLDTLAAAHTAALNVIAVPSYEDGFTQAQKNQLQQWYRSKLGSYVLITDGLYTRRTSGAQQNPLFKWLTDISLNESFDTDVTGPECKFFVSSTGELYSVLPSFSPIEGHAVQRTLQIQ